MTHEGWAERMEMRDNRDLSGKRKTAYSLFACPKCKHGWPLSKEELKSVSRGRPLPCRNCGEIFGFLDAVRCVLAQDNPFLKYQIRSNHMVFGNVKISLGQMRRVDLRGEFNKIHKVFLGLQSNVLFWCEPLIDGNSGFIVISSRDQGAQSPETAKVSYGVYGNKKESEAPPWVELLSDSMGHEIEGRYRTAIVELETCFEVFLVDYVKPKLNGKFSSQDVDRLLEMIRRPEDRTNLLFELATGKTLKKTLDDRGETGLYGNWSGKVKEKRDRIVHRGESAGREEAKQAFDTVFIIIICLWPESLEFLAHTVTKRDFPQR